MILRNSLQRRHNPRLPSRYQQGVALVLMVIGLVIGLGAFLISGLGVTEARLSREQVTQKALQDAKAALLDYAVSWPKKYRPVTGTPSHVSNDWLGQKRGPGRLPCPDTDDSGAAVGGCGNETGSSATSRIGRLPWRRLGLPDTRDGHGERLWYAVSSKYKTNDPNYDLNPDTGLGTITIRDSQGNVIHDGTNTSLLSAEAGGAVAVVFAPGPPITRWEDATGSSKTVQTRGCTGPGCDAAGWCESPPQTVPRCNPVNYLERASGFPGNEDNANFVDRNDDRTGNGNGFIHGPVKSADGTEIVNDRLIVITYHEIMQEIMKRVALEVENCMLAYATLNGGRYPFPAPTCRSGYSNALRWSDREQVLFGRVPDPLFDTTSAQSSGAMQQDWNTSTSLGCTLGTSSTEPAARWWDAWKGHTFIAIANNYRPGTGAPATCTAADCLQIADSSGTVTAANKQFAVIVAGPPVAAQTRMGGTPEAGRLVSNFLEGTNPNLDRMNALSGLSECEDADMTAYLPHPPACSPLSNCNRVTVGSRTSAFNDVVIFYPR